MTPFVDWLVQDARYSLRTLWRAPAFTWPSIATLALGIGFVTAIFSIVDAVLLRPLPYPNVDRLLALGSPSASMSHSGAMFHYVRERMPALESVGAYRSNTGWNMVAGEYAEYVRGLGVSTGYFEAMGVAPLAGRTFTAVEDQPDGPPVAIVAESIWREYFDGRPDAIGAVIQLGGTSRTIVGVMPASFESIPSADVWTPLRVSPRGGGRNYTIVGRLRAGASASAAAAQLSALRSDMARDLAEFDAEIASRIEPLTWLPYQDVVTRQARTPLLLLLGAVGLILLLACTNVAGIQLVRATTRRRELATRAALGCGTARITAQLISESVLLSLLGAIGGVGVAHLCLFFILPLLANLLRMGQEVSVNATALGVALLMAFAAGLVCGVWPALEVRRHDIASALRAGGGRFTASSRALWTRRVFVFVQVAVACLLLASSGLLLTALARMFSVDPGFEPDGVMAAQMSLQGSARGAADLDLFYTQTLQRVRALPGVEFAAIGSNVPVERGLNLRIEPNGRIQQMRSMDWRYVTPGYFDALRIPLRGGRDFDNRDTTGSPPVAIVNEAFARAYFDMGPSLGQTVQLGRALAGDAPRQIVGVVGDVRSESGAGWTSGPALAAAAPPAVYFPAAQVPERVLTLVHGFLPIQWIVRARGDEASIIPALQQVIRDADPRLPLIRFTSMAEVVSRSTAFPASMLRLLGAFAVAALTLAAIGLYGLIAYEVTQRRQEIGVRMALGAAPARILYRTLREGVWLTAAGVLAGIVAAAALSRALTSLVFVLGARPLDLPTSVGVAGVLILVAGLASLIPASRAVKIDPATVLRSD